MAIPCFKLGFILCVTYMFAVVYGDGSCDTGWLPYNGNCYKFTTTKAVPQAAASKECQTYDASLPRIHSTAEITWLTQQMKTTYPSPGFWTDLNDKPKVSNQRLGTGNWLWGYYQIADMSYIHWNQSPANDGVATCAGMNIQGKLADLSCQAKQGYICKLLLGPGCPLGWLPTDTACYWVSNTSIPAQLKTWSEARDACVNMQTGSQLLVLGDASDTTFITSELPYISQNTKVHWLGLVYSNGAWGWYTNDPVQQNLLQWQSEPDNVAGIENCAALRMSGNFTDRDCSSLANFICFKPQTNSAPVDNLGCGPWIRAGKMCYGILRQSSMTWAGARSYCQNYGADLLKVDSIDKMTWINTQLMDQVNERFFWCGLNDQSNEGTYVWADGTPVNASFMHWNQEPNDYKGYEDCALIFSTGQYNDMGCSNQASAICEIDGLQTCPIPNWVAYNGNCYLFTPYRNSTDVLYSQPEAAAYCATFTPNNKIGALLSVESKAEHDWIKAQVQKRNNKLGFWTSLNDQQTEGYWSFTSGPLLDPTLVDWAGEPSTAVGDNCGVITFAGAYHERNCNWKLNFICERYATGVTQGASRRMPSIVASVVVLIVIRLLHF